LLHQSGSNSEFTSSAVRFINAILTLRRVQCFLATRGDGREKKNTANFGSRPAITAGLGLLAGHHLTRLALQRQVGRYLLATAAAIIYAAGTSRYTGSGRNLHGNEFVRNTFPIGLYHL